MTRTILDLGALDWQFGQAPRRPFGPAARDDRTAVREWLPAVVPGDVRADLIAAGRIPPVETPEGIAAGAWVDDCDWWYRTRLPGDLARGKAVFLEADGIDYYSAVWLDGRRLATHAGMFARQVVPLSPWADAANCDQAGTHELAIRVWGGGALPRLPNPPWRRLARRLVAALSPGTEYFPDRMATPKAQFSFGWDFAPRLLSAGIWDEIRLVTTSGSAYIEDLVVRAEPLTEQDDPTPVCWRLRLRIRHSRAAPLRAHIIIEPVSVLSGDAPATAAPSDAAYLENDADSILSGSTSQCSGPRATSRRMRPSGDTSALEASHEIATPPAPGTYDHDLAVETAASRRWWPWDQGEPCLYRVTVQLSDGADVVDELSAVTGVRSVHREEPWRFVINGRPVFLRGANWTPADVLPGRVTAGDYVRLLGQARAVGVNFLRVWGGGIREKRSFWETCDRLGLLAWQEFPLACAFLDHYPRDRAYLDALASEARGIVRALRNHPSLIAWCGGNEFRTGREALPLAAITGVLAEEDPDRVRIPASPSGGDVHQWDVWHGLAPWTTLAETAAPLMSEFGLQALPAAETVATMFRDNPPQTLEDSRWAARKAQAGKLRHYAGPDAAGNLAAAIDATQRAQATALQVGLEACRLRRESPGRAGEAAVASAPCFGVAFWQLNEPWPAVSWSVIDRAGRPKAAFEMLQRSFQPILIAARFPWRACRPGDTFRASVWLVNDTRRAVHARHAEARLDGTAVWSTEDLELPAGSTVPAGEFSCALERAPVRLDLELMGVDGRLACNRYDLSVPLPPPQPLRARLMRRISGVLFQK